MTSELLQMATLQSDEWLAVLRNVVKLEETAHPNVDTEAASPSVAQRHGLLLLPLTSRATTKVCMALFLESLRFCDITQNLGHGDWGEEARLAVVADTV